MVIALPDGSRPVPVNVLLPGILQQLFHAVPRLEPASVTIILGNGLHPPPDHETIGRMLASNIVRTCNIVTHVAGGARMKDFGTTRRGTPVRINAAFGDADFKMVIGLIEPHQFFGFTGGAKEAVLGCGSVEGILHNHCLICDVPVGFPALEANPMREDLDEAGQMIGIDFAVDVVLDSDGRTVRVLAGKPEAVLEEGAATCQAVYGIGIDRPFDIIVGSIADTAHVAKIPRAMKSLSLLCHGVKPGGKILLLAALQKELGEAVYFDFVCPFVEPNAVGGDFLQFGYAMGALKADLFGGMSVDYNADAFQGFDGGFMNHWHLRAADPSAIMEEWVEDCEGVPEVAVVPRADATYFYPKQRYVNC